MSRDKKTPKSEKTKSPSDYQSNKKSSKVEIISTAKPSNKKGK